MPNDKVTSSVDWHIKQAYELTFDPGKAVYKEMIEEGMLKRIEEFDPIKASKIRIERYRRVLEEEEANLKELEFLEKMERLVPKKQNKKVVDPDIEDFRFSTLERKKDTLRTQLKNNSLDWGRTATVFKFKTQIEAKEWIMPKLQEA